MENYKIRVKNEEERKEAQELFLEFGATGSVRLDRSIRHVCTLGGFLTQYEFLPFVQFKEITIPQLRDLVVLKRNYAGDATHDTVTCNAKGLLTSDGVEYFWDYALQKWNKHMQSNFVEYNMKPIENIMKEYLDQKKNYDFCVSDEDLTNDGMIEIPEGSEVAYFFNGSDLKRSKDDIAFYKDDIGSVYNNDDWLDIDNEEVKPFVLNKGVLLWQRETKKKKEPFGGAGIKTHKLSCLKESLNDQYAEIEQVRQAIKSDGGSTDYYKKEIPKWMLEQFNQTGVIEAKDVIRLFLGNDFNKGNIFKAQVRINSLESGAGKDGISGEYDHNKIVFFAEDDRKAYLVRNKLIEGWNDHS